MITLKTPQDTAKMRAAGVVVAAMLAECSAAVRPGVTTADLDRIGAAVIERHGATSSFKGYYGYPATICASVNEEIVHGIPGSRKLKDGDIISIDVGAIIDGWHADAAVTVPVGTVSPDAARLISVTEESLRRGIASARVGKRLGDIGAAVQQFVEAQGYTVVRNYVGHGIGRAMHEEPQVPNYGPAERGMVIREGLCIAIEPMVNIGGAATRVLDDHWTVVTADGSLSAHFEHSIWCTADGPVVLTAAAGAVPAQSGAGARSAHV